MQKKDNAPFDNQPDGTKHGRPEEANFVKKQVSREYPKANYQIDLRTVRTSYSRHHVSLSEDMGGHLVTCRLCNSDKYEIRAVNGRCAHLRYIDASVERYEAFISAAHSSVATVEPGRDL